MCLYITEVLDGHYISGGWQITDKDKTKDNLKNAILWNCFGGSQGPLFLKISLIRGFDFGIWFRGYHGFFPFIQKLGDSLLGSLCLLVSILYVSLECYVFTSVCLLDGLFVC